MQRQSFRCHQSKAQKHCSPPASSSEAPYFQGQNVRIAFGSHSKLWSESRRDGGDEAEIQQSRQLTILVHALDKVCFIPKRSDRLQGRSRKTVEYLISKLNNRGL